MTIKQIKHLANRNGLEVRQYSPYHYRIPLDKRNKIDFWSTGTAHCSWDRKVESTDDINQKLIADFYKPTIGIDPRKNMTKEQKTRVRNNGMRLLAQILET